MVSWPCWKRQQVSDEFTSGWEVNLSFQPFECAHGQMRFQPCILISFCPVRVYRFPVFEKSFCEQLLEELEHFEQSSAPKGRPNTMNHYGVSCPLPLD